jgi:hypothetical protein
MGDNVTEWQTPGMHARRTRRSSSLVAVATVVLAVLASGCASSDASEPPPGRDPVARSRQFCAPQAQREISESLGTTPVRVTRVRFSDHVYSCRYVYRQGAISLMVTGFPTEHAAKQYADALARRRGRRPEPPAFGEEIAAFVTTDGSIVVRKNADVLVVDMAAMPESFGQPPQTRSVIAKAVAVTILGHWVPG